MKFKEWIKGKCYCGHVHCMECLGTPKTTLENAFKAGQKSLQTETQGIPDIVFIKVNEDGSLGRAYTPDQMNFEAIWPPGVRYIQYDLTKEALI